MDAVRRGLGEKHVLVYMVDPTVGEIMRRNGWDGALAPTEGDFVMVVDTNMGFNKLNPNVETAVEYQVTLGKDDSLTGRVVATYRNDSAEPIDACVQEAVYPPTYQEMMEGCYWNYLRLYVPEGSELLEGPLLTLPEGSLRAREDGTAGVPLATEILPAESGKGVFGVFFVVRPGERREMVFEYKLPSSGVEGGNPRTYRLLVQKQPGTGAVPIRVVVSLPTEAAVVATHPEASDLSQSSVVFETDLREDREFEVTFQR
jgi:hypothetical protein